MTVTLETVQEEGEPVFKARRKDILKGKDIGNQARKCYIGIDLDLSKPKGVP